MSDTTTITPEERAEWRHRLTLLKREVEKKGFRHGCAEMALRLMDALEQAEAESARLRAVIAELREELRSVYADGNDRVDELSKENAKLRERLETALDKIAEIEDEWESEGVCHACGICAGIPDEWQPTDDHCCRVVLDLWSNGEPLPWQEAARRAVGCGR